MMRALNNHNNNNLTTPLIPGVGNPRRREGSSTVEVDKNTTSTNNDDRVVFSCHTSNFWVMRLVPLLFWVFAYGPSLTWALVYLTPYQRRYVLRSLFSVYRILFVLVIFGCLMVFRAMRSPQWIQLQADGTLVVVCQWRNWVFRSIESVRPNAKLCWMGMFQHIRTDFATGFQNRVLVKFSSLSSSTLVLLSPEDLEGFLEAANRQTSGNHTGGDGDSTGNNWMVNDGCTSEEGRYSTESAAAGNCDVP